MFEHQLDNSQGNYHYNAYIYADTVWHAHFHACYELIYAVKDKTEVYINANPVTLFQGEMILVSPYTVHSLETRGEARTWVGVFSDDFIPDFSKKNRFTRFSKFKCDEITDRFLQSELFYEGKPRHYRLVSCLYMVCGECIKNSDVIMAMENDKLTGKMIEYLSENMSEDVSMKKMAASLKYEYHYFSGLFHKNFSVNFKSFVNMFRFERACALLRDKTLDITEVCSKCGFGSIRNFNRVFKQKSGVTPGEYRKMSGM